MTATATKTSLKKWIRPYSISFNSSKVSSYFLELKYCIKVQAFSRRSRAVTTRKYIKKRDTPAELLFCKSKPLIFFLPFSLTSPSSLLKLPNGTVRKIIDLHKFTRGKYGTKSATEEKIKDEDGYTTFTYQFTWGCKLEGKCSIVQQKRRLFAVNLAIWYIVFF